MLDARLQNTAPLPEGRFLRTISSLQVKPHGAAGAWCDLPTAARILSSGQPLPAAAPLPAPLPVMPRAQAPAPSAPQQPGPRPGPPPASINGGSGAWVGHSTPAQQLASFQRGAK